MSKEPGPVHQTQTTEASRIGQMLAGRVPGACVHLFVRAGKLRETRAAPFLWCGTPVFEGREGEKPITIRWRLSVPVPDQFRRMLGVPA